MKLYRALSIFLTLSLLLSACDVTIDMGTAPTADVNINSTFAAQTVQAVIAGGSLSTPTAGVPAPAIPSLDSPTLRAGVAIDGTTAEPGPGCNDLATHTEWTFNGKVYDVKVVNTPLAANTKFVMAWTIKNTGSCTWDDGYIMRFESGTKMTESVTFPLLQPGQTLSPEQSTTLSIDMTAPAASGEYRADWQLLNTQGTALINFGIIIKVGVATTSSSLGKPADLRYSYDCSGGVLKVTLTWLDKASGEDGYRIYRDGAQVAVIAANSTAYVDVAPKIGTYTYTVAPFNSTGEAPQPVTATPTNCL